MIAVVRSSTCALVAVLWAATLSQAQQPLVQGPQTGTIVGTVLDITGGAVPDATVVLQGANEKRTLVTGNDGFFTFDRINPEIWRMISFEATRCFPLCCTRTRATSIKVPAQRNPAFSTQWQLHLSPRETTGVVRSIIQTSSATWHPVQLRTPTTQARTVA